MSMERLSALEFSDLVIARGNRGALRMYLKGVPGAPRDGLVRLPETVYADAHRLLEAVDAQEKSDFRVIYDDVPYRGTRERSVDNEAFYLRRLPVRVPPLARQITSGSLRERLLGIQRGLVVVSGQMGSGKTTTASALIAERLRKFGGHAITMENPPELPLEGTYQTPERPDIVGECFQYELGADEDFGDRARAALRDSAPNILFFGELRSPLATQEAISAGISGHLVIATIHGGDIEETLRRLLDLGRTTFGEPMALLANALAACVHLKMTPPGIQATSLMVEPPDDVTVRAHIREGKLHNLRTVIERQANLMRIGRL